MERIRAWKEALSRRRAARAAFRDYARNGWQSPWIRRNRWIDLLLGR